MATIRHTYEAYYLRDGVYAVDDDCLIEVIDQEPYSIEVDGLEHQKIKDWLEKYPGAAIAHAYQMYQTWLLSKKPQPVSILTMSVGSSFSHGTQVLIENPPRRLLILAQDD